MSDYKKEYYYWLRKTGGGHLEDAFRAGYAARPQPAVGDEMVERAIDFYEDYRDTGINTRAFITALLRAALEQDK